MNTNYIDRFVAVVLRPTETFSRSMLKTLPLFSRSTAR
jgi:hypothetical protein